MLTHFTTLIKVTDIRSYWSKAPEKPGLYKWWFPKYEFDLFLANLSSQIAMNVSKIENKIIDGTLYYALYIGKAEKENIRARMKWHIAQKHTKSAVRSGTLSTLRQTISSLLGLDMTNSEDEVNKCMDTAYIEFCELPKDEISKEEMSLINGEFLLPLNIQGNKKAEEFAPGLVPQLKKLRKTHKE